MVLVPPICAALLFVVLGLLPVLCGIWIRGPGTEDPKTKACESDGLGRGEGREGKVYAERIRLVGGCHGSCWETLDIFLLIVV